MQFSQAIDDALGQAMSEDDKIIIFGEDVQLLRRTLLTRFGPRRIMNTPISESAFIGAGIAAAMAGLRPVVEVYLVDFLGVAMDALLNHAAKLDVFSGGKWQAPIVIRAPCGAGIGDGGQHMQSLWGWLAHIPGLSIVVPATPDDAGRLMYESLKQDNPVVFMEHKLISEIYREFLGYNGRQTIKFDVPAAGTKGHVTVPWTRLPYGVANLQRQGDDLTIVSIGIGVHRALQTAEKLSRQYSIGVIDLRTLSPLDKSLIIEQVAHTGRLLIVDEDYERFGLSGEIAAIVLESGMSYKFARVCTRTTIPYAHHLEKETIPNVRRICQAVHQLMES